MDNITNSYTFWVAIVGCITGCLGLLISLLNLYRQKFRFKIIFDKEYCCYFKKLQSLSKHNTDDQAGLHFTIVNKSTFPITIHSISTLYRNSKYKFSFVQIRSVPFTSINFTTKYDFIGADKSGSHFETENQILELNKQIAIPIRLNAFDAVDCTYFVHWLPKKHSEYIVLKFSTTRGNRYRRIHLSELEYVSTDTQTNNDQCNKQR